MVHNKELFNTVSGWMASNYPGIIATEVIIRAKSLHRSELTPIRLLVPLRQAKKPTKDIFAPTVYQKAILAALDGKAMRTADLADALGGDRRRLFKDPGGIKELKKAGMISNHPRLGYYRIDSPPPELKGSRPDDGAD